MKFGGVTVPKWIESGMEIKVFLKVYIHRKRKEKGEIGIKIRKSYIVSKLLNGGLQFILW
jgi:hypothetical protein